MKQSIIFNKELISRYNLSGPRYTSYPSALEFNERFGIDEYLEITSISNSISQTKPLSLYLHLPFCNTVCFYCACNKIITANRERAAPYLKDLHREIELQARLFGQDRPVKQMHWGGGTPTFISDDQMQELMQVLRRNFGLLNDDSGEYSIEIDPREVRAETITLLRSLGFNRMSLGVQDFDTDVQKAVNRIQSYEQTRSVIEQARGNGFYSVNVDLIYGLPRQSVKSFANTVDQVISMAPDRIAIYNYAHLPHLFKTQKQINEQDLPAPSEKLDILGHAIDALTEAGYIYIGMDHFAKPDDQLAIAQRNGNLYRNFQGYSTNADCDVVGMGVTSISKIHESYSQNYRTLEEYHAAVEKGQIPVFRGYLLDLDDRIRRDVISQLICHFELEFSEIEDIYGISFSDYFKNELGSLLAFQDDGLIVFSGNGIEVLPAGRFFIRNICSVFDRFYKAEQPVKKFSRMI